MHIEWVRVSCMLLGDSTDKNAMQLISIDALITADKRGVTVDDNSQRRSLDKSGYPY